MPLLPLLCLSSLLVAAALWDVLTRRIPNWLTASGMAAALVVSASTGWGALAGAVSGIGLAFVVSLVAVSLGMLGGGDGKLLMAVGGFVGPAELPMVLVAIALVGGLHAMWAIWRSHAFGALVGVVRSVRAEGLHAGLRSARPTGVVIPYGVPIALGTLIGVTL